MPLTVACASAAACVTVLLSVARLDRPSAAVSAAAPSAPPGAAPCGSTLRRKPAAWPVFWLRGGGGWFGGWGAAPCGSTLRRKPAAWPVFWLRSSRRSPEGSDKTAALTPAPAPLIL